MTFQPEQQDLVKALRGEFEDWRRQHPAPKPYPKALWARAANFAVVHGVSPIARALKIDFLTLRKHVGPRTVQKSAPDATFLELFTAPASQNELIKFCKLELDSPRCKVKLELSSLSPSTLAVLLREVLG
jgi:hypothetical protein